MRISRLILSVVVTISILFSFLCVSPMPAAAGDDGASAGSKIGASLAMRVEMKLGLSTPGLDQPTTTDHVVLDPALTGDSTLGDLSKLESETVFIHFTEQPTEEQINDLEADGIIAYPDTWIPPVGDFSTGFILAEMPVEKLQGLAAKDYVASLNSAELVNKPQNDQGRSAMNVDPVWTGGYKGSGVTVAVLDSGIDTTNADFPVLNSGNSKDYSNYDGNPGSLNDTITNTVTGHGTHVTGSVLGRGVNSSTYKGVASEASLVFLKIGNDTNGGATYAAEAGAIRAAVDTYNADIITMSYGGWSDSHDGTNEVCQAVDYAVEQGATVFISAGNYGGYGWHYSGTVAAHSSTGYIPLSISAPDGDVGCGFNLVWYDGPGVNNSLTLHYYGKSGTTYTLLDSGTYTSAQTESSRGTENQYSRIGDATEWWGINPTSYKYYLKVENTSGSSQPFHIYNNYPDTRIKFTSPDPQYTLNSPAEATGAIAVGAYVTRNTWTDFQGNTHSSTPTETVGQIAYFSARGPRVDDTTIKKPEIVAPGSQIISVRDPLYLTTDADEIPYIIDNDGSNNGAGPANYYVMEGTSMACPLAAGVGALILDMNSALTPAQVKQLLENTATDKGSTGFDTAYGYGLVNAQSAVNSAGTLELAFSSAPKAVTAGAASSAITIQATGELGIAAKMPSDATISLVSDSATGRFDTSASGQFNGTVTSVIIPAGSTSATFYYKDTKAGAPTIKASAEDFGEITQIETVNAKAANKVVIETAANGTGTAVTDATVLIGGAGLTLYGVTRDQYDNYVGNPSCTWSLPTKTGGVAIGDLSATSGTSITFTGHTVGTGIVRAVSGSFNDSTGTITVALSVTMDAITEPQGQFFATAPILSHLGFDDVTALDDVFYQIDSYSGAWLELATNVVGTSWNATNWAVPGFDAMPDGSHTVYFKATNDSAIEIGNTGSLSWQFYKDVNAPALKTGTVSKTTGYTSDTFVFSVAYSDPQGDVPAVDSVTLTIDAKAPIVMTLKDDATGDYITGEIFEHSMKGSDLGTGTHTYSFTASDGTNAGIGDITPHTGLTVKKKSSGGGGGGGGGGGVPPAPAIQATGLTSTAPISLNTDGTAKAATQYKSNDGKLTLDIATGTKLTNSTGAVLTTLSTAVLATPPAVPEGNALLLAYEFGPEGATFNPALTLTFSYGTLPEGAKNLSLMYWNGTAWESVQAIVDTAKGTVTASISHFSKYALIYQLPSPANIAFTGITITPETVKPNGKVTIQAKVTNSGDLSGTYKLTLKVNDRQVEVKEITVAGGKTETVSFEVQRGMEGEYPVDVNGQKGKFTVGTPVTDTPTTSPTGPVQPTATVAPPPTKVDLPQTSVVSPSPTYPATTTTKPAVSPSATEDKQSTPFNWALLVGIIGAVLVLVVIMVVVVRRPKKKA